MWFAKQAKQIQWRKFIRWLLIGVLSFVLMIAWWVQHFVNTTQSLSLWSFKSMVSYGINNPAVQRTALTLMTYFHQHKPIPQEKLLILYDNWYQENCVSLVWKISHLTWSDNPWCILFPHRELLLNYLWYREPKTYLILLQNSAEVRPNGWFYGSFIRVTLLSGMIQTIKVHDSYEVPFVNSGVSLNLPARTTNYLGHNSATFIAGNKFGFTDRDGFIIRAIYNKTYQTSIDGVIFISTKTLVTLIPSLQDQLWKWQFINASVDLIRGKTSLFKKDLYLASINQYLSKNKVMLLGQALSNYTLMMHQGLMQVYVPNPQPAFRQTLKKLWWITDLDSQYLYARDINQSYSKVDTFVKKHLQVQDQSWMVVVDSYDNILDLSILTSGSYKLHIWYSLTIPSRYKYLIKNLEQQYAITLTGRERYILWLDSLFEYKSVIFAGTWIRLNNLTWGLDENIIFDAWDAQAAAYHITSSGETRTVTLEFIKK